MTDQVYKSAKGKMIDMARLVLENEAVVAVGNMKANARGDLLENGKVVKSREELLQDYYNQNPRNI
jgi:hypothetical protein